MTIPLTDGETLSRLFHLNSEPWPNVEAYRQSDNYEVEYKSIPEAVATRLPGIPDSFLFELLYRRFSCREFRLEKMPLEVFSFLLKCGYGITRMSQIGKAGAGYLRTAPSAGGLFPLEVYVLAREVNELSDGIYHYNVREHSVEMMQAGSWFEEFDKDLISAPFVVNANLIFFFSAIFNRTQKKYGPRGYRYILLEAGHVAQNLCLAAAEHNLGSLCMGGYYDTKLNHFFGFDDLNEGIVYSVAVGYAA